MLSKVIKLDADKKSRDHVNKIIFALFGLAFFAVVFTLIVVRIQSGATVYLAGLSIWSRAQVEAVKYSELYAQTGQEKYLTLAQKWYQIPVGDMQGRKALEQDPVDIEKSRQGFLRGLNHPDDVSTMILIFRTLKNAPYLRDAVAAWRDSDASILALGEMLQKLKNEWGLSSPNPEKIEELTKQLQILNKQLELNAEQFREKMSAASRALVFILSLVSLLFFILLFIISAFLILRLTRSVRHSELKFRKTFEYAGMGIAQLDNDGRVIEVNDAFCHILKFDKSKLQGKHFDELTSKDLPQGKGLLEKIRATNASHSIQCEIYCGDGSIAQAKVNLSKFIEPVHSKNQFICIIEDISEQHRLSIELNRQAKQDDLTGLVNRRSFKGYLESAVKRAQDEDFVHCLCFIDLDRFKIVNDSSGHFVGDQILQQVAKRLSSKIRKHDILARLGGDEFGLILDCCDPQRALQIANSLRKALTDVPFIWQDKKYSIGCSIGIAPITSKNQDLEELLKAADLACHMAKEQGRDRVILTYDGDESIQAKRTQYEWIHKIRSALENNRLVLEAQKIVSASSQSALRLEVLVRMIDEEDKLIPPGDFLPAAERYGLVHLIDRWVINEVCSSFLKFEKEWTSIGACHINISGRSFDQNDFTEYTLNAIDRHQIPAEKLCFEITETAAVSNLSDVYAFMLELREKGSSFALDDFGSGLASFSYLKQIPVEYLKIDGAFVKNMANDDVDCAMVKAICNIGHALNKVMVAEFVQDEKSRELLNEMGVEFLQGFFLHRPDHFEAVLKNL